MKCKNFAVINSKYLTMIDWKSIIAAFAMLAGAASLVSCSDAEPKQEQKEVVVEQEIEAISDSIAQTASIDTTKVVEGKVD